MMPNQPSESDASAESTPAEESPAEAQEEKAQSDLLAEPSAQAPAEAKEPEDELDDDGPPDLENRQLCPDGACIGVIGPDGRCKVCGAKLEGAEKIAASKPTADSAQAVPNESAAEEETDATEETDDSEPQSNEEADTTPLDFSDRTLCSDGACIGVIGPDGHCKVCGKPYTGPPED